MIRPMQPSDIPRVAEIHTFGWRSAYRGIVSDEHLFNVMSVAKRIEKFHAMLENAQHESHEFWGETYVYDDGIVKGFLTIGQCRDDDKPGAFELGGLYVDPCLQGQGVGAALTAHCEMLAAQRGHKEIFLWTFEKNAHARAFYEKQGYAPDGATQIVEPYGAVGVRYRKHI